jgi:tetratricopeptide (TPR) repeat protein
MATFYYNRFSGENYSSQWSKHIQTNAYFGDVTMYVGQQTRDISGIVSQQTREINDTILGASREQVAAIQESTNAVCGTLESGFNLLSDHLSEISYGISEISSELNAMSSMLDWKLSLLVEQQRISNLLLGNLAILLRIPDIQKERQYHIEQGIKFLKNAIFDNDFYDDSLNNLQKAEVIEPTDFFALHRIGIIYLYSQKHLNLPKAEEYFKKSAKYAIAETNNGASITTNYLSGDTNENLSSQTPIVDNIKLQAAEAYLFAGRCCYIQGKFDEAANLAGKAFNLVPQMVEAGFTQAKSLSANNNESQAAVILEQVIRTDRFYSLKTISDLDLSPKQPIRNTLEKLKQEAFNEASERLNKCKSKIQSNSQGNELLKKIERLVNVKSFLTSKKAIDLLNKTNSYSFQEAIQKNNSGKWESSIEPLTFSFSIEELINYENTLRDKLNIVRELITANELKVKLNNEFQNISSGLLSTSGKLVDEKEETKNTGTAILIHIAILIVSFILISTQSGILWFLGILGIGFSGFMMIFLLPIFIKASDKSNSFSNETTELKRKKESLKEKLTSLKTKISNLEKS